MILFGENQNDSVKIFFDSAKTFSFVLTSSLASFSEEFYSINLLLDIWTGIWYLF